MKLKRHTGWFWNVTLPLGLFFGAISGVGMMVKDLLWDGVLDTSQGWIGCGMLVGCAITFKFICFWFTEGEDADRRRT